LGAFLICFIQRHEKWLFIELASLISLILGIYIAIKFLYDKSNACQSRFWSPKYIEIIALASLIGVVLLYILAKVLTIMDFAFLGYIQ
jgi:membrane protein required for colicin V production